MRTPRGLAAGLLAAALTLTACSTGGSGDSEETDTGDTAAGEASALMPEGEGSTTYPLTLESPYGKSTLEERPERIAVLGGLGELEAVLGLGASPVTTPQEPETWPWWQDRIAQLDDAAYVSPWADSLELEKLAGAEPDLIIALSYEGIEDDWEALSAIAPVLAPETEQQPQWQEATEMIGTTLDLGGAAEQLVTDAEASVTDAAAEHPEYEGKTVAILMNYGQEAGLTVLNSAGSSTEELLSGLGFAPHPNADAFAEANGDVALENLSLVEADGLLVARHGGHGSVEDAIAWLEGSDIYESLEVVQRGDVGFIDQDEAGTLPIAWAFSYPNALTLPYTVSELTDAFGAIFGDS